MRLTLLLFIGSIVMTTWSKISIFRTFEINSTQGTFSHMVLDNKTGNIYIGAMNNLYQLSSKLTLIKSATTGPKDDSPMCQPKNSTASCNEPKQLMDAYNKALVIDYKNNKLIACSSLYNGICERYSLRDIQSRNSYIYDPVVATDATSTTVAFIAPGPPKGDIQSDVLYVAASRANGGQSKFPAIASRVLETFKLVFYGIHTKSSKDIQAMFSDTFQVHYIYGFSSEKFSYFVTVQKRNPWSGSFISKLIRVCQADKHYYSYAEVQLKCMHNGALYNLAQAAYVGKAGSSLVTNMEINEDEDVLYVVCSIGYPSTAIPEKKSALCVYPLRKVRQIFTENIRNCFDGIGNTGPSHIITQASCKQTNFTIKDDYCGEYDSNNPIDGQTPIQTEAVITFNTTVSAVAVNKESQDTIAFVGTVKGHVIKVLIKSKDMATSYEDLTVEEGSKINTDMILYKRHLYVFTDRRIYKVQIQECNSYTLCESCVNDEYCGWVHSNDTCSVWDVYKSRRCMSSYAVLLIWKGMDKYQIPFYKHKPVVHGNEERECVFSINNENIKTKAHLDSDGDITCAIPSSTQLPAIATGEGWMYSRNDNWMEGCQSCSQSRWLCGWCIRNHSCTYFGFTCPGKTILLRSSRCAAFLLRAMRTQFKVNALSMDVGGNIRVRPLPMVIGIPVLICWRLSASIQAARCLALNGVGGVFGKEWRYPATLQCTARRWKAAVKVAKELIKEDFQTQFNCFFNMEDTKQVNANLARFPNGTSIIECEIVNFSYTGDAKELKVPFHISWDIKNKLDSADQIQVIMYKCDKLAESCGECLTLNSQYECGWCDQHCTSKSQCSSTWLSTADTCPNAMIINIEPTSGPKGGGTYINITGINLVIRFEDISIDVYIENSTRVQCDPVKDLYIAPRQIVCISGKSNVTGIGKLVVTINKKYNATGSHIFSYVSKIILCKLTIKVAIKIS
ncbi:hypothetical protein CHS0354_008980 [Potamilus streckersoni]|uniref:Sema domain-containing protein n=1 Tax=Potamilus streckersoni TaxID=2493646 RepID=A0AAE0WDT8_9BIVA|nr:hypothetical protein CHS0354_008980 [Potamilus streckersoni]